MSPKSVIIKTEKNLLYWKNVTYLISVDEAKTIMADILKLAQQPEITVMLVDNRGTKGAWPTEVNLIWGELMRALAKNIKKSATVAEGIVVMQINRISKNSGTFEQVQAFENINEAKTFLGVAHLPLE